MRTYNTCHAPNGKAHSAFDLDTIEQVKSLTARVGKQDLRRLVDLVGK